LQLVHSRLPVGEQKLKLASVMCISC
jgi:hypothetical protein